MHVPPSLSCVESRSLLPRRLSGSEAVVIVVIVTAAAVLTAVLGLPLITVLELLLGAGMTAVLVVAMVSGTPARRARTVLRALSGPAA